MVSPSQFETDGFLWKRQAVPAQTLKHFPRSSSRAPNVEPAVLAACQEALADILPGAFATKATLFAKSEEKTWSLGWHQDRVIAVAEKQAVPGFVNWSRKSGVWHVEPPIEFLRMGVFVQLYCDPVGLFDGGTEIAIGSHRAGKVSAAQQAELLARCEKQLCLAEPGDILICRSLLLHRSTTSKSGLPRRILRLDFASFDLPKPLEWNRL